MFGMRSGKQPKEPGTRKSFPRKDHEAIYSESLTQPRTLRTPTARILAASRMKEAIYQRTLLAYRPTKMSLVLRHMRCVITHMLPLTLLRTQITHTYSLGNKRPITVATQKDNHSMLHLYINHIARDLHQYRNWNTKKLYLTRHQNPSLQG